MPVSKTTPQILPAVALGTTQPPHIDADQRYIRNPNLSPAVAADCDTTRNIRDLMVLIGAGSLGATAYMGTTGINMLGKTKGNISTLSFEDKSDLFLAAYGTATLGVLSLFILNASNPHSDDYYSKCMIKNPNFSAKAAAVSDGNFDFTAIKPWIAAAAVFSGHQVVKGVAGELSVGTAMAAGAASVFAPFFVSLRSFVALHEPRPNIL